MWWLGLACSLVGSSLAVGAEPVQAATQPALQTAASGPAGQATITVDAVEHDFGSLRAGDRVEHRFKVTNSGSGELQITNVKTNCGCTVAGDYPKSLAPGASGEIPLALSTVGMNGPFSKVATVSSNDPAHRELNLVLKGEAKPLISVLPAGVYFGSVYGEQPQTQVLNITNNGEAPLKLVLDPLATSGPWTFDMVEKEAGKRFELTASFNPKGLKPGYVRQAAQLLSNVQAQHQINVQATAAVRNRIEAEPSAVMLYAQRGPTGYAQAGLPGAARPLNLLAPTPTLC